MKTIVTLSHCPERLINKAVNLLQNRARLQAKTRKICSLRSWRSIKLNRGYRLLLSSHGKAYIASHDDYERKIASLKK